MGLQERQQMRKDSMAHQEKGNCRELDICGCAGNVLPAREGERLVVGVEVVAVKHKTSNRVILSLFLTLSSSS